MAASSRLELPPGGSWIPFVGDGFSLSKDPIGYIQAKQQEHGSVFRVKLLGFDVCMIAGMHEFQKLLEDEETWSNQFPQGLSQTRNATTSSKERKKKTVGPPSVRLSCQRSLMSCVRELYGEGPLICDGQRSKTLRSSMFGSLSNVELFAPRLRKSLRNLLRSRVGQTFCVYPLIKEWCTESLLVMLFGDNHGLSTEFLRLTVSQFRAAVSVPLSLPGSTYRHGCQARDAISAEIRELILRRIDQKRTERQEPASSTSPPSSIPAIDQLLDSHLNDATLSVADVELCLMWLSSNIIHKTTASTITSFVLHFCRDNAASAEIWTRLKAELASEETSYSLLSACVRETERLWPAVSMGCRGVVSPVNVGGYMVPSGWQIAWSTFWMNRDPRVFPEPCDFLPSRWLGDKPPCHATYGHTSRLCPGQDIARLLCTIATRELVRDYSWTLSPKVQDLSFKSFPVLKPRGGCQILLVLE